MRVQESVFISFRGFVRRKLVLFTVAMCKKVLFIALDELLFLSRSPKLITVQRSRLN